MIQRIHMAIKGNICEIIFHPYAKYIARYKQEIWRRSDVCIVNFKHISHIVLLLLLLTLSR